MDEQKLQAAEFIPLRSISSVFRHKVFAYFSGLLVRPYVQHCRFYAVTDRFGSVRALPDFEIGNLDLKDKETVHLDHMLAEERAAPIRAAFEKIGLIPPRQLTAHDGCLAWVVVPGDPIFYHPVLDMKTGVEFLIKQHGRSPDAAAEFLQTYLQGILNDAENMLIGKLALAVLSHPAAARQTREFICNKGLFGSGSDGSQKRLLCESLPTEDAGIVFAAHDEPLFDAFANMFAACLSSTDEEM